METSQKRRKGSFVEKAWPLMISSSVKSKAKSTFMSLNTKLENQLKKSWLAFQKCLLHWPSLSACTGLTIHLNTFAQFTPWQFFWATKRSTLISWISSQVVWAVDTVSLDMKWKLLMRILMKKTFVPFTWLRIAKNVKIWFVSKSRLSKQNKVFKFKSKKAFWMKSWTWSNTQLPSWEVLILSIWMFQKKFWWPQWKRTNVTLLYVTLMVNLNQTSSQSVMVTLSTWKMLSEEMKKYWWHVLKTVNSSGVKTKNLRLKTSLLNWLTWPSMKKLVLFQNTWHVRVLLQRH